MTVYQGTSFTPERRCATGYALFRAGIKVSAGTCEDLAESLRRRHQRNGTRWRLLSRARAMVTSGRKTGGQRAFYSGKHKRHGLNVQTVCSPAGELLWAAAPQPGATVDVTAARKAGIAAILTSLTGVSLTWGIPAGTRR